MLGGWLGLLTAVVLMILGPTIWVQILGHEKAIFPYEYPALFSISVAFPGSGSSRPPITRQKATVNVSSSALSLSAPKRDSAYNKDVRINLTVSSGPVGRRKIRTSPSPPAGSQYHHHAGQHHDQTGDDALLLTKFIGTRRARPM